VGFPRHEEISGLLLFALVIESLHLEDSVVSQHSSQDFELLCSSVRKSRTVATRLKMIDDFKQ